MTDPSRVLDHRSPDLAAVREARSSGVLILLAAATLWSLSGVAVKYVRPPSAEAFAFWRSVGALGLMLALLPLSRGRWPEPRRMALAAVLYTGNIWLLIKSMSDGTAAQGILLQYTGPTWCGLLAWAVLRRRLSGTTMTALGVAAIGVAAMLLGETLGGGPTASRAALAYGLLSGLCYGAMILALESVDRTRPGTDAVRIVLACNVVAVAVLGPIVLASGRPAMSGGSVALVLLVGVVQLGLPYVLFQVGMRRVGPVEASVVSIAEPVLNPVWVWLVVGEVPTVWTAVGGACIVAALLVETLGPRRAGCRVREN